MINPHAWRDLVTPTVLDRFGGKRCGGYRQEDYVLCVACGASPGVKDGDPQCPTCGGYGEVPK